MVNKVILIGRIGRDPEVRRLENGTPVAKFSVATSESYKDKNGEWQNLTEWHDIVLWRQLAERAERDLKKGMLIFIEGKLTHRKYQDKDGNDRYITEVVGDMVRSMEKREGSSSGYVPTEEYRGSSHSSSNAATATGTGSAPIESNDIDDDLPF